MYSDCFGGYMDYGVDLRHKSLHILTLFSFRKVTRIAIEKWQRGCSSRAHAVDVLASCSNSLETYFIISQHNLEEMTVYLPMWTFLAYHYRNHGAKFCCVIQIFFAILWVTIHDTVHNVGGKTTWRFMLCSWPRANEKRDLTLIRSDLRQRSLY